jgi:putative ABC transport system permease protein
VSWILWTILGVVVVMLAIFPRVVILFSQGVLLALGQIWTNKLRSFLTTIGIVIGVASVTAVISALSGLEAKVLNNFETFGTNKMFVFPNRTVAQRQRFVPWSQIRFNPLIFNDVLTHAPSVKAFTRVNDHNYNVTFEQSKIEGVGVIGIEASWHEIEGRLVTVGRTFSLIDNERGLPVCLVNGVVQDQLGLNRDPSGQSIIIGNRRFTVIGVVEPNKNAAMFGGDSSGAEVFIPFSTMMKMNPEGRVYVIATSVTTDVAEDAVAELTFFMRNKRGIRPGDEETFRVEYVAEFVERFKTVATVIRIVATCIVGISLIVGGVGIMNIMFVSVSERTREIGLRKAVGATPFAILLQFLIEAVTLCCIGGAAGLGLGQMLTLVVRSFPTLQLEDAYIPVWAIILSIGFSAAVGLLFGMFPAIKAARLDPIDALRHE